MAGCFLLGFSLVPALIIYFFYHLGAGHALYFGTLGFNSMAGLGRWHRTSFWIQWALFAAILLPSWGCAAWIRAQSAEPKKGLQSAALFFGAMVYFALLRCFWPLLDREHDLPFYPLFFAVLVPAALHQVRALTLTPTLRKQWIPALGVAVILGELARVLFTGILGSDYTRQETRLISEVLRLAKPGECVVDLKGETVFEQRCIWPVYEGITLARLKANTMKDDIPERALATRSCIATLDNWRFQKDARQFLNANYVPVGEVRVAGQFLKNQTPAGYVFRVEIHERYDFVDPHGPISGTLDGKPWSGSHFIKPGEHCFQPDPGHSGPIALVWARAIKRGFSPFTVGGL